MIHPTHWWYVKLGAHYVTRVGRDHVELVALDRSDAQEFDTLEAADFVARKYGGTVEKVAA